MRSSLFELIEHIKRWFVYLLNGHAWLLEIKHKKLPFCTKNALVSMD
jgi:hypothetical protein